MAIKKITIGTERGIWIPERDWEKLMERLDDLEDILACYEHDRDDDGTRYTLEEVEAELIAEGKLSPPKKQPLVEPVLS